MYQGDGITGSGGGGHAWNMVSFDGERLIVIWILHGMTLNDGCEKDSKVCHYITGLRCQTAVSKAHEAGYQ